MTQEEDRKRREEDRLDALRNYAVLAFVAVLAATLLWLVGAFQKTNQRNVCIEAGHHDCMPLDTSDKGR
ncbi:MAG TPA: hypothetical protein VMH39_02445 [Gemmatimonadaceae bacterium]|nr:hypothetical protein [Gemmatimonadaceae bacterium]